MGLLDDLRRMVSRRRKKFGSPGRILKAQTSSLHFQQPDYGVIENQELAFQQITWIHVAVSRLAKSAAQVPFEIYKTQVVDDELQENSLLEHPMLDLLNKPNPDMTRMELWEATVGYLFLTGNAYWFLSGPGGGAPTEIDVLRSDRVKVVPGKRKKKVAGYIYEVGEEKVPLNHVEVVHFKLFHPRSDFYGLSPIEAAAIAAESDWAQAKWNQNYFAKGKAIPEGMVVIKGTISPSDFERFKEDWVETYGGKQRKTAIVRANDVDWKNIAMSHKEMEFLKSRQFNKQEIFDIYDIPAGATDPSSTEANAVTGLNYFKEYSIWPILTRLQEKVVQDLLPFFGGDLLGRFKDIRPIDRQLDITEMEAQRAIRTFDEARALEGLQPLGEIAGVDVGALPFGVVERATFGELIGFPGGDPGNDPLPTGGGKGETPGRERPSRADPIDDNPANKPKKKRQGMAAKPEKATKDLKQANQALRIVQEMFTYKRFLEKRGLGVKKTLDEIRPFNNEVIPDAGFKALNRVLIDVKSPEDMEEVFKQGLFIIKEGMDVQKNSSES